MKLIKKVIKNLLVCIVVALIILTLKPTDSLTSESSNYKKTDMSSTSESLENIVKAGTGKINAVNEIVVDDAENTDTIVLKLKDIQDVSLLNITEDIYSTYSNIGTVTLKVPEGIDSDALIKKYKNNENVEDVFVDQKVRLFYTPSDPYYSYQWNLQKISMESAWDESQGDSSVIVAVLDTGIDQSEDDLDGYVNGADTSGDTIREDTYPGQYSYEGGSHGTAVTSVIASNLNSIGIAGIAPNVSIMPVKVFPDNSDEAGTTQIAAGIRWAADNGADIINLSLGSDGGTTVLKQAVSYATSKGVIIIAASGNEGYTSRVSYPAAYSDVIAVGSTGEDDTVSEFSNEGDSLDLVAPGEDILAPDYGEGGYSFWSGTSFSSPEACALAALIESKYPDYSNDMIKSILYVSADDIADKGWDKSSGYGLINAGEAMTIAKNLELLTDDNDTFVKAENIVANKDYTEKNFPLNDVDYYKFTLYEPNTVNITVTPSAEQDMIVELYNSSLGWIKGIDSTGSGKQEILSYQLGAGEYYVKAYESSGDVYSDDYIINVQLNDVTPPLITAYQDGVQVTTDVPTLSYLNIEAYDTSAYNISVIKDNVSYDWPVGGLFTQDGHYIIVAQDFSGNTSDYEFNIDSSIVSVRYRTHVQEIGWQNYVSDGAMSGTSGQSKRLEAINIQVTGGTNLGIKYSTHVQEIGWQNYVSDGAMSGTSGQSKRLEAIKIVLTGTEAVNYDIYYRVHAQDYGWLDWAKNGEASGTEGLSKRLEAIQIQIVPKGTNPGLTTTRPFVSIYGTGNITYRTHVQDVGWQNYVGDSALSGTTGKSKRLEAINIHLSTNMPSGSVVYQTHVQDYGWMSQVSNGAMSGTQGQAKRLEAIRISLMGEAANEYDIYYRVHAQNFGWLGWAKNGESSGTAGFSYRLEAIQVQLVPKGGAALGSANNAFIQR